MSVRLCLKIARERVLAGLRTSKLDLGRDLIGAIDESAANPAEADEAIELIESIACPAANALYAACLKWGQTQDNADGRKAVQLAKAKGADQGLYSWVEAPGRTKDDLVRVLNTAILKSK